MDNKIIGTALVAILVIAIGAYMFPQAAEVREPSPLGASAGPDHYTRQYFHAGSVTGGGGCFATSTGNTLAVGVLANYSCIHIVPTGAGQGVITLTLPTAAQITASVLPSEGSCAEYFIDASDVAVATTTTIAAGTNVDLVGLDATGAGTGADVIDGAEFGTLKLCHHAGGRVVGFVKEWIHAD